MPRLPPPPGGPGPGRRPAPQDRRRPLAQGRARGLDRPLPEGHRPAQGRAALHRAGAPLRGGRLALHAHRRQHAGDLRLREGAAARRAARRGARPRAARTGSSAASSGASATPRRRARTSSARSSWPATPTRPRRCGRCSRLGYHLEVSEADYERRRGRLRRGADDRDRGRRRPLPGRAPCRARRSSPLYRADWEEVERETEASAGLAEREGLRRQALLPVRACAARCAGASGDWERRRGACRRAHEIAEQVGRSEVAFSALYWLAAAYRDQRRLRRRRDDAGAGARRLRARRPRRAVAGGDRGAGGVPGARRPRRPGARGGRGARSTWPSACTTRSGSAAAARGGRRHRGRPR